MESSDRQGSECVSLMWRCVILGFVTYSDELPEID